MINNIFGKKDYIFELNQLSQKAQYILMKDCNNFHCYFLFMVIYDEIRRLDELDNNIYKNYFIYDNKKIAVISNAEFRYIFNLTLQTIRRALQRLQEKNYIELVKLNYGDNTEDEIDAMQVYGSNKYGYAITEKGYNLINNLEI